MEPRINLVLQSSLVSYRHELFSENYAGIPILQQHGSEDDNVPAHHSRRLSHLNFESGFPSQFVELSDKGHWFEGVMTTQPLRDFYRQILTASQNAELPQDFQLIVTSSGDFGSRGGIVVDQLIIPDQLAKVKVHRGESLTWTVKTSNVLRFHFSPTDYRQGSPHFFEIDGTLLTIPLDNDHWFVWTGGGSWTVGFCRFRHNDRTNGNR